MKAKIAITFIFFFHILAHYAIAQNNEIKFNLVEGNNGESLGNINGITQDLNGYMWFSGQKARCLYRYDGNRMITFRHDSLNANSLGGTNLETVYADGTGMIWVGFFDGGLDRFNPATGIFTHFRNLNNDPGSISPGMVNVILRDHKGMLWIGTANGLDRLDEKTGNFIHYRNEPENRSSLSSNVVRAIYEDHRNTLWIGTGFPFDKEKPNDGGLNRMESNGTFTRFMHDANDPNSLINNKVRSIFEDSRGTFWVGTGGDGLHTMDREKGRFERHLYNPAMPDQLSRPPLKPGAWHDHITFIREDGSGAIWMGTYVAGISRYDPITKKITHYESSNGYPDRSGWMAYTSTDGILWISASEKNPNLYRVDPSLKNLKNIVTGNRTLSFLEDNEGYLWTAVEETGLQQYDREKKLVPQFNYNASDSFKLFLNGVNSIFKNLRDTLWLSTDDGITIFNKTSRHFTKLHYKTKAGSGPYNILANQALQIIQEKSGLKWIATLGGLIQYNPGNDSARQYLPKPEDSSSISSGRVTCILQDRYGEIWAGTYQGGGLNRLNKPRDRFRHYLKGFNILCLYEDSAGLIWAGTEKGLYRYDRDANTFVSFFDPQSEIGVAIINGITEDKSRNLWISTQSAIVKVDAARKQNFIYGKKFGIRSNSLIGCGIYTTAKGEILVGYSNGFYYFNPDELAAAKQPLGIIITDFFINNLQVLAGKGTILQKPIEETSIIILNHNQNNLSFRFAAIDYRAPEMSRYYTMLKGYDDNWRDATGEKSAFYLNIPPGKYIFRVKTFNSDGIKGEKAIQIIMNPPWWRTWWAYSLYALILGGAIFVLYHYQKQRIIRNERIKTQLKEIAHAKEIEKAYTELKSTQAQLIQSEKMASLGELTAGIAHEIQNPLNFVNNFSEINTELLVELEQEADKGNIEEVKSLANDIKENEQKINHHGKRADAIVKGMLQHSRTSSGRKEPTDINALADDYLRLSYHGLRAKDKDFNANFKTEFDESIGKIEVVPQDIGRVLLNLFNNAFYAVHEKQKACQAELVEANPPYEPTVSVSTKRVGDKVEIFVRDNGNGIPAKNVDKIFQPFFTTKPTGQGTGLGLSLSYDIIKAHGGELKVETKEGEGTTFIIQLPVL